MLELILNGISSKTFGITLRERPVIPVPDRDVEQIQVRGRNGSLTRKYKYNNMDFTVRLSMYSRTIKPDLRQVKAWLLNATKLEISDDVGYYIVDKVSVGDIENTFRKIGVFEVVFNCKPFIYKDIVVPAKTVTPFTVVNNGTVEAEPIIKITGSGNITLNIGGRGFNIVGLANTITIDSEMGSSYNGTTPMDNKTNGELPYLDVGSNVISYTGTVTKVEISYKEGSL